MQHKDEEAQSPSLMSTQSLYLQSEDNLPHSAHRAKQQRWHVKKNVLISLLVETKSVYPQSRFSMLSQSEQTCKGQASHQAFFTHNTAPPPSSDFTFFCSLSYAAGLASSKAPPPLRPWVKRRPSEGGCC